MMAAYRLDETSTSLNLQIGQYLVGIGKPDLARHFLHRVRLWTHSDSERDAATRLIEWEDTVIGADDSIDEE